ncbi:cation diffusion facilitator family transporter domain protein, partial [Mycobacterium xenopi 4042]
MHRRVDGRPRQIRALTLNRGWRLGGRDDGDPAGRARASKLFRHRGPVTSTNSIRAILAACRQRGHRRRKFVGFLVTAARRCSPSRCTRGRYLQPGLLLLASARPKRADALHPFGYGRSRYFWSFVVAWCCSRSARCLLSTTATTRSPTGRAQLARGGFGHLGRGNRLGSLQLSHGDGRVAALKGNSSWWGSSALPAIPSCPWCCWKTPARSSAWCSRWRGRAHRRDRDPVWDGIGTIGIGVLLGLIAIVLMVEMH